MFENLRRAFQEAIDNFYEELNRDRVPETVDKLLHAMQVEMTDVRAQIRALDEDIQRTTSGLEAERRNVMTCLRREDMARRIGDADTARLAREFAEKHERKRIILEQKLSALREERTMLEAEFAEMTAQFKKARSSRSSLAAQTGRAQARDSIGEAGDLFEQLDRMAERIQDEDARAQASQEMSEEFDLPDLGEPDIPPARDLNVRLEELKRRMGRSD